MNKIAILEKEKTGYADKAKKLHDDIKSCIDNFSSMFFLLLFLLVFESIFINPFTVVGFPNYVTTSKITEGNFNKLFNNAVNDDIIHDLAVYKFRKFTDNEKLSEYMVNLYESITCYPANIDLSVEHLRPKNKRNNTPVCTNNNNNNIKKITKRRSRVKEHNTSAKCSRYDEGDEGDEISDDEDNCDEISNDENNFYEISDDEDQEVIINLVSQTATPIIVDNPEPLVVVDDNPVVVVDVAVPVVVDNPEPPVAVVAALVVAAPVVDVAVSRTVNEEGYDDFLSSFSDICVQKNSSQEMQE